jgi:hypothetical protein
VLNLRARVGGLERAAGPAVCPACADRRGKVALVGGGLTTPDGTVIYPEEKAPAPCRECGRTPEDTVVLTYDPDFYGNASRPADLPGRPEEWSR